MLSASRLAAVSLSLLALAGCSSSPTPAPEAAHASAEPPKTAEPVAPAVVASASFTAAAPSATTVPSAPAPAPVAEAPALPLPEGLKVLVIGDSFGEALGSGVRQVRDDYHIKAILKGQSSTFIPQWAGPKFSVPLMLKQERPDVVLIALGGNELAMADPTQRTPDIEKIVKFMGDIPCVWVSTPSFGKENDLPAIIRSHSSPCRYYDSNALSPNLPRGSDKIHPTYDAQKIWAEQVLDWLKKERDPSSQKFALKPRPSGE